MPLMTRSAPAASALRKPSLMSLFDWFDRSPQAPRITLHCELEQETDGRWIADITDLPGVMAYGQTQGEATQHAMALALRVLADRVELGEVSAAHGVAVELAI